MASLVQRVGSALIRFKLTCDTRCVRNHADFGHGHGSRKGFAEWPLCNTCAWARRNVVCARTVHTRSAWTLGRHCWQSASPLAATGTASSSNKFGSSECPAAIFTLVRNWCCWPQLNRPFYTRKPSIHRPSGEMQTSIMSQTAGSRDTRGIPACVLAYRARVARVMK